MAFRKKHSAAFKQKISVEAIKEKQTTSEIASQNGVHPTMVSHWKKHALEAILQSFEGGRSKKAQEEVPSREELFAQVGKLQVENEWLKKKLRT